MKRVMFTIIILLLTGTVWAAPPAATIVYQPMTAEGLAVGHPFEAWVYFDKSPDPMISGYAFPQGSTLRFKFPAAFKAQKAHRPQAVLLNGWPQGPIEASFTIGVDPQDPLTIVLKLNQAIAAGPPQRPGLKAIHLRWGPLNPQKAGNYPITIDYQDAGTLTGSTKAMAQITPKPIPNIAAYGQLNQGRNENYQRAKIGQTAELPIDFLVTLPDKCRSFMMLKQMPDGNLEILSDGEPIGTIIKQGVPITLKPHAYGPGFSRLGIIRLYATAGLTPKEAEIEGRLTGGTSYIIRVFVEP